MTEFETNPLILLKTYMQDFKRSHTNNKEVTSDLTTLEKIELPALLTMFKPTQDLS